MHKADPKHKFLVHLKFLLYLCKEREERPVSLKLWKKNDKQRKVNHQKMVFMVGWLVGWLFGFYGISTFIGYLTPNQFLYK